MTRCCCPGHYILERAVEQRVAADEVPWSVPHVEPLRGTTCDGSRGPSQLNAVFDRRHSILGAPSERCPVTAQSRVQEA